MIVVKMVGGLGNQMFQYALFRRLLEMGKDVYYDALQTKEHNGFEINKVFNIVERPIKSLEEIRSLKIIGDHWPKFDEKILHVDDNSYLEGNWQNIGYFPSEDILRNDFTFKQELDEKNKKILEEIQNSNSISIHARKTDYEKYVGYFFQADWMNYYGMAVNYIVKNVKERPIKFFVFSDDIMWCKKNMMIPVTFVETSVSDAWKDLLLMSNCKYNITTNSTFSWWAAWFNNYSNKIVTTPKRWVLDNTDTSSITLKEWIRI